ncbi:L,D-transpeptidase [Bosea sp. (in: a-proteobacteria)]|jgi:lipoprotein-anchoring transpeptidase ErfK/SrfK|uniref:L,D-transpeptidase n=1 Tax=Bosea sp. (in: a-proteobacteria) TaxID=1871050 RepID=UPI003F6FD95D
MRPVLFVPLVILSGLVASNGIAAAQSYERPLSDPRVTGSMGRGNYGGGFIEMLVTGRDPTSYGRGGAVYNRPGGYAAYGQRVRPAPGYEADPFEPEVAPRSQGRRTAALGEPMETARPIERVLDPRFQKQEVAYDGPHKPGTIIIDTPKKFLFLVQPGGRALRYGIGVGRPGFEWAGMKTVTRKAEWPSWTPPAEMLKRRPDLPRFMAGGPENPMGARALYLGSSLYRIHGTNEPHTIGQAVSSGCIRMTNDDVTDLYGRVRMGAKVLVI